jgi:hypothetical protein
MNASCELASSNVVNVPPVLKTALRMLGSCWEVSVDRKPKETRIPRPPARVTCAIVSVTRLSGSSTPSVRTTIPVLFAVGSLPGLVSSSMAVLIPLL